MIRAALLAGAFLLAAPVQAQATSARFEISAVTDTTVSFRVAGASWVRPGATGIAVDPRRRDVLVARFRVLAVSDGVAHALITGQTTDVSTDHVATLVAPQTPWYRRGSFWAGLLLGGLLGAAGGAVAS